MKSLIALPRGFTIAFLACIYILGFLLTPYWILHPSTTSILFYYALTIGIGWIWLHLSTDSLQIEIDRKDLRWFLVLAIAMIALNYRALNSVIPFRGDEALHIDRTLELVSRIPLLESLILAVLLVVCLIAGIKKERWVVWIGAGIVIAILFFFLHKNSFEDVEKTPQFFLRYPFINYWLFALIPKLASLIGSEYHEALYRIIPILSMIGTAWVVQKKVEIPNPFVKMVWGIAIATIPLVFYYSSILYLEPLAIFLMTIVCLDMHSLLQKDAKEILQLPSWYALILIGFIKETTIPFLLGFIVVRFIVQSRSWSKRIVQEKSGTTIRNLIFRELGVLFSILAPAILYIYFRATLTHTRSFVPQPANLLNRQIYHFIMTSLLEQLGPFLLFFIGGCILLVGNKDFTSLLGYMSLVFATLAFYAIDEHTIFVGYSRFNLFVLPPVLAGSVVFMNWVAQQKQHIANVLLLFSLTGNLLLSPVYSDGTKKPYWGNWLVDTSEHYYPYQVALVWVKNNYPGKRILFTGLDFYYPFQFYWNKLDWKPKRAGIPSEDNGDEQLAIANILKDAEIQHFDIVVYRVLDEHLVVPQDTDGFRVQVIQNSAHRLILFYKP